MTRRPVTWEERFQAEVDRKVGESIRKTLEEGVPLLPEGTTEPAADSRGAMAERASEPTTPVQRLTPETANERAKARAMAQRKKFEGERAEYLSSEARVAAGLKRTIAALSEELRKAELKLVAAKIRKEWTEVQALQSAMANLDLRLGKARQFLRQVTKASDFVAQVEKDLGGAT